MSNLISRSALTREVWKRSNNMFSEWDTAGVLNLISNAPTVETRPSGEWIPCEIVDHPEHCRDCEVTRKDTVGYVRDIAFYTDKWRRLEDEMPIDVIAWKEPSSPYDANMRGRKNERNTD